ncbi:hypothetical protein ATY37_06535 [Vibrio cidicii]|uniref:Uncharacterized protein n=1 Tax=Vibrio cidicii TaxID=1763883 RepID=A0A151KTP5_9VIBR|nr:hypothetical protein ATY37_06535 [Vibrio cidicii]
MVFLLTVLKLAIITLPLCFSLFLVPMVLSLIPIPENAKSRLFLALILLRAMLLRGKHGLLRPMEVTPAFVLAVAFINYTFYLFASLRVVSALVI